MKNSKIFQRKNINSVKYQFSQLILEVDSSTKYSCDHNRKNDTSILNVSFNNCKIDKFESYFYKNSLRNKLSMYLCNFLEGNHRKHSKIEHFSSEKMRDLNRTFVIENRKFKRFSIGK